MLTFYPPLWWLTAAFRPEVRSPELTWLLNDIAWLQFIGGVAILWTMYIAVAVAAFIDDAEQPTFPRWCRFYSLFVLMGEIPGQLLFLFKTGPFAWNGLISFWIAGTLFFSWFVVIGVHIVKACHREQRQYQAST